MFINRLSSPTACKRTARAAGNKQELLFTQLMFFNLVNDNIMGYFKLIEFACSLIFFFLLSSASFHGFWLTPLCRSEAWQGHGQPGSVARFFRTMIQGEGEMEWFDAVLQQCGSIAVMPVSQIGSRTVASAKSHGMMQRIGGRRK